MKRCLIFGCLLLLLCPVVFAENISAPVPAQAVSFESLTKNLRDLKEEVSSLKKDLSEAKAQLSALMDSQYNRMLFLLLVFNIGFIAACKLLGRVWDYLVEKKFQRSREDWKSRVLRENKEILKEQGVILERLDDLSERLDRIQKNASLIEKLDSVKPEEKKPWWRFF